MNKPTVGQVVFCLNINNAARNCEQRLTPTVVTKVGRLYFWCCKEKHKDSKFMHHQIVIETGFEKSDYSPSYRVYETHQEWSDEKRRKVLSSALSEWFRYGKSKFTLNQLIRMTGIAEETE